MRARAGRRVGFLGGWGDVFVCVVKLSICVDVYLSYLSLHVTVAQYVPHSTRVN